AWPDLFMKVAGLARITACPAWRARATQAKNGFSRVKVARRSSAKWSASQKPALWRVASYSGPGLPSPTMRRMGAVVIGWGRSKSTHHTTKPPPALGLAGVLWGLADDCLFGGRRFGFAFGGRALGGIRLGQQRVGVIAVRDELHALGQGDVRQVQASVAHQAAEVDFDELRQVGRQAGDVEFGRAMGDDLAGQLDGRAGVGVQ